MKAELFNRYVVELLSFRATNGEDAIPRKESKSCVFLMEEQELAGWVIRTNDSRREFESGKPSTLTCQRIRILSRAGFPWAKRMDDSWEENYNEIVEFWKVNGHSDVPQRGNLSLGCWVNNQRKAYKKVQEGKASSLTEERKGKLELINFKWRLKESPSAAWNANYMKLVEFRGIHNHCNVRREGSHIPLANWVYKQRSLCRKKKQGELASIADERVDKLLSIKGWE